jgi:hypothetical protein
MAVAERERGLVAGLFAAGPEPGGAADEKDAGAEASSGLR